MKIIKAIVVVAAGVLIFSGCSSFQLASQRQNISVQNISPNTFTVNFCGNAYMTQREVDKYALQRASQLALSKGYSSFVVLKKDNNSQFCTLYPAPGYGAAASSQASESKAYDFQAFMKPNVTLTIQCFAKGQKTPEGVIDADQFLKENFPGLTK